MTYRRSPPETAPRGTSLLDSPQRSPPSPTSGSTSIPPSPTAPPYQRRYPVCAPSWPAPAWTSPTSPPPPWLPSPRTATASPTRCLTCVMNSAPRATTPAGGADDQAQADATAHTQNAPLRPGADGRHQLR